MNKTSTGVAWSSALLAGLALMAGCASEVAKPPSERMKQGQESEIVGRVQRGGRGLATPVRLWTSFYA